MMPLRVTNLKHIFEYLSYWSEPPKQVNSVPSPGTLKFSRTSSHFGNGPSVVRSSKNCQHIMQSHLAFSAAVSESSTTLRYCSIRGSGGYYPQPLYNVVPDECRLLAVSAGVDRHISPKEAHEDSKPVATCTISISLSSQPSARTPGYDSWPPLPRY